MEKNETKVLSVRVAKKLGDEAREFDVDIKSTIEEALEKKIARAKTAKLSKLMKKAIGAIGISKEDWVKTIRESRDER